MRRALAVLLTLVALVGCGRDEAGRAAVSAAVRQSDAVVAGALHRLAAALRLDPAVGRRSFTICGDTLAPRGVVVRTFLRFPSTSGIPPERTAAVLRNEGWSTGRQGQLTLDVQDAGDAVLVSVVSDCVATSRRVAREYDERPPTDVPWS